MRLFHLIKEDDRIGLAAHRLGQLSALVVADVAGRRADQARDRIFLHIFAHINAHEVVLIVKKHLGKRLCQLGLAHARRAEEQEGADRAARITDARAGAQDGIRYAGDGLLLADHAAVQNFIKTQELIPLPLHQLGNGNARPTRHDAGDLLFGDLVTQKGVLPLFIIRFFFFCGELFFKRRQPPELQLGRLVQVVAVLGALDLRFYRLDLLADPLRLADVLLFPLPARFHFIKLRAQVGKLLADAAEMLLGELIGLLFQGGLLDLELHNFARDLVKLGGHRVHLGFDKGAGLVDQVDRLVGQETVGNIAVGQRCGCDQRGIVDLHAVIDLVALFEAAQDGNCVLHGRLRHQNGLKAAFKSRILLDIFAVFVKRGGTDAMQLPSRQHGL